MYVCMYVRMYVCKYVCIFVCMYVCMYVCLVHSWQFIVLFLYGASVLLNIDRHTSVRLSNRVIVFNQSKRSEWFSRILYFTSLVTMF